MCLSQLYVKAVNWELNREILTTCSNLFLSVLEGLHGLTEALDDKLPGL